MTYTSIFNFKRNAAIKIVCEEWIAMGNLLYENQDGDPRNWIIHNLSQEWNNNYLWLYNAFRRNRFIYLVQMNNTLMRIDTKEKKIEAIDFI